MTGVAQLRYRTTSNVAGTRNYTAVNPKYLPNYDGTAVAQSDTAKVKTAVQALNSLTTNTFVGVNIIATEDITAFVATNPDTPAEEVTS